MKIKKLSDLENHLPNINNYYNKLKDDKLREHTYLSTYPEIIKFSQNSQLNDVQTFKMLALMTYAWMPRVLRIDDEYLVCAASQLSKAKDITKNNYKEIKIQPIADCLHSLVGASKILHFINPEVFPIWDSKIQIIVGENNNNYTMKKSENYYRYVDIVYSLIENKKFYSFYKKYNQANHKRLKSMNIEQYDVSPVRAIEASIFEMANNYSLDVHFNRMGTLQINSVSGVSIINAF